MCEAASGLCIYGYVIRRRRGKEERERGEGGREVVGGSRQGASAIGLRQELECE